MKETKTMNNDYNGLYDQFYFLPITYNWPFLLLFPMLYSLFLLDLQVHCIKYIRRE